MEYVIDIPRFRAMFSAMADADVFPDDMINAQWMQAQCFISPGKTLAGHCYENALYIMTAHLTWSNHMISMGQTTAGVVIGATISKVSVSITPPPARSAWQFWLSTTPHGVQLWALLNIKAAGGAFIGGLPERTAFRKVGGVFF